MEEEIKNAEAQEPVQEQPDQPEKPLEKMTAPELREIAIKLPGVAGVHAMKKGELLALIDIREQEAFARRTEAALETQIYHRSQSLALSQRPQQVQALVEDMLASGLIATGERHPEWGNSND